MRPGSTITAMPNFRRSVRAAAIDIATVGSGPGRPIRSDTHSESKRSRSSSSTSSRYRAWSSTPVRAPVRIRPGPSPRELYPHDRASGPSLVSRPCHRPLPSPASTARSGSARLDVVPARRSGRDRHRRIDRPRRSVRPGAARRRSDRRGRGPTRRSSRRASPPSSVTACSRSSATWRRRRYAALGRRDDRRFGRIDVLVNNAGFGDADARRGRDDGALPPAPSTSTSTGLFSLTPAGRPAHARGAIGIIVNIASVLGLVAVGPDQAGELLRGEGRRGQPHPPARRRSGLARACGSTRSRPAGSRRR